MVLGMRIDVGTMGVDWEDCIDFVWLWCEWFEKVRVVLRDFVVDLLFVFCIEDVCYLIGYCYYFGLMLLLGNVIVVLCFDDDPIFYMMDYEHCCMWMLWLLEDCLRLCANFCEDVGICKWVEGVEDVVGSLAGKTVGIDFWSVMLEEGLW